MARAGTERCAKVATLVERFGDRAVDVRYVGAAFIEDGVASAPIENRVDVDEADRIAGRCRTRCSKPRRRTTRRPR